MATTTPTRRPRWSRTPPRSDLIGMPWGRVPLEPGPARVPAAARRRPVRRRRSPRTRRPDRHPPPNRPDGPTTREGDSDSIVRSRSAATPTAIVAGSLPVSSGSPIGVRIRAIAPGAWPSAARLCRNRVALALEPMSPMVPRCSQRRAASHRAASSAWSWVMTSTWVPLGTPARTSSGSTAWCTRTRATASSRGARRSGVSCSARESTRCRSRSCRARMRASSSPTWPIPNTATDGSTASGSRRNVTSPPQHWRPCSVRATWLSDRVICSGSTVPPASISRARSTAVASRLPPPMLPQVDSAPTTILAPASRGACPRTATRVTSTPGRRSRRSRSTASSQPMSATRP